MNRRSLIQILIGVIASLAALTVVTAVREDRCLDAGGKWVAATRACVGPDGPLPVSRGSDVILAIAIGLVIAFMLYRASTFAQARTSRPST